ncbi:hypothetical protein HY492_00395 [Candidatus Woesearchaeota archaeon]|nr:hypothetical protein [Candidatus Woesearchaeota archaeon]
MAITRMETQRMEHLLDTKRIIVQAQHDHLAEDLDASLACVRTTYDAEGKRRSGFVDNRKRRAVQSYQNGVVLNAGMTSSLFYVVVLWQLPGKTFRAVYWGEGSRPIEDIYRNRIEDIETVVWDT